MQKNLIETFRHYARAVSIAALTAIGISLIALPSIASAVGSLDLVKDVMTTSRPSVASAILSAVSINDTTVEVSSTAGILSGDTVTLLDGANTETATVAEVLNTTHLALMTAVTKAYTTAGKVYYKSSATHTVDFKTKAGVNGGSIVLIFPVDSSPADSIPGAAGFDFNSVAASDVSLTGATAGTVTVNATTGTITVPFTGTISANTLLTVIVGSSAKLINPTKTAASGTADTWVLTFQEMDKSGSKVVDQSSIRVATIEAVAVSATVAPTLTFTINAVAQSESVAGASTDATTTSTTAPFGTLTPNVNRTVAQYVHVDTNADSGYSVTVYSNGPLKKTNGTTIDDFSPTAADNNTNNGFGYSLQNKSGADSAFQYNSPGTFNSKGFTTSPVQIMSNSGPVAGSETYVAYRVKVSPTQPSGDYQTNVTYVATATY